MSRHSTVQMIFTCGFLFLLRLPASHSSCPFLCDCSGTKAQCNGISSLTGFPLPDSISDITINAANLPVIEAGKFRQTTSSITFESSAIGEIQTSAIANLNNLNSISFRTSSVERIRSCGISSLSKNISVEILTSRIKTIDAGGFSDIAALKNLTIHLSSFTSLKSFAFQNIQAKHIALLDSSFDEIGTAAFHKIQNTDLLELSQTSIKALLAGAFYEFEGLKNVRIGGWSRFDTLEHKTLDELRHQTLMNGGNFEFQDSVVGCDCASAPFLEYAQSVPHTLTGKVLCANRGKSLLDVSPRDACGTYKGLQSYCTQKRLAVPQCQAANGQLYNTTKIPLSLCPVDYKQDARMENFASETWTNSFRSLILCCIISVSAGLGLF